MINAGKYRTRITIFQIENVVDKDGFAAPRRQIILQPYASVKTLKGMTLIANGTDFEKAYTNFTIRYPKVEITRDMLIDFLGKEYTIEYLNNVNGESVELEIQAKEVTL